MKTYVFDLDGTLFDCSHRLYYIKTKPKNFIAFEKATKDDKLIEDIYELYKALFYDVYNNITPYIYICTGRSERVRDITIKQLQDYNIFYNELLMRPLNDNRKDYEVKKDMLDYLISIGRKPDLVFEDRDGCVKMYRENDIRCLQVCNEEVW